MKKMQYHVIVRLVAAVLLAAVIAPAFVTAQEPQAPQAGKKPAAKMVPREDLGLTPEQKKSLDEFRQARMEEGKAFREEMMKIRGEMRELAKDPKANEAKIDGLIDNTAKLRAERAKTAFKNRGRMEKIFTPEQLEKMKAFQGRLMGRAGLAGPGRMGMERMGMSRMGMGRMGMRGPGMSRFMGPRFGERPLERLRALRHRPFFRWRRW